MGCSSQKPKEPPAGLNVEGSRSAISGEAKIVLLGESGVGKSSIAMRYVNNIFTDAFEVTIGGGYL